MAVLIDGKALAKKIREELKIDCDKLRTNKIIPKLAVIMVGDNPASKVYVRNKSRACEEIGIEYEEYLLEDNIKQEELIELIEKLNEDKSINGILLQSPIPGHLNINQAFKAISYRKDVDGFTPSSVGKLSIGEDTFISCTPYGVIKMFEEYNIDLTGKDVVIVGRSNIVGKPLIQCRLNKNATVTVCHSKVVIDVGINRNEEGKLVGDVDFENIEPIASHITPVPGGVGPMTIAMLMNNVIKAAKEQNNKNTKF